MRSQGSTELLEERRQRESVADGEMLRADDLSGELSQHVEGFVGQSRAADDGDRVAAVLLGDLIESLGHMPDRVIPGGGHQPAALLVTNQRRANAILVIDKRMSKATFDTEELAVDAVDIAIARHHAHQFTAAGTERHLTTVGAIGAGGDRARQFPGASLM